MKEREKLREKGSVKEVHMKSDVYDSPDQTSGYTGRGDSNGNKEYDANRPLIPIFRMKHDGGSTI
uniref:Uncharacterized protein n=1 Tax=Romanomermis culicivorax TaxID=13658 RepID=A0A915KDU8_ROMCU